MQAMRYGCIPIVRKTGGLADTVDDFNPRKNKGDGFVFEEYDPIALYTAIIRANTIFELKNNWNQIIRRAMKKDFSWEKSAKEYLIVFHHALQNSN